MTTIKQEWVSLMRPLVDGHATSQMVSAFDQLTSRIYSAKIIDFEEFLGAQTVIVTARKVAQGFQEIGQEGCFLLEKGSA